MKKFRIISICASLCLMIAMLAFGVYSASTATITIGSSVSFEVQNVFVEVAAGLGKEPDEKNTEYYYSQPTGTQLPLTQLTKLPDKNFSEEEGGNEISYFVYIKNLHSRDIKIRFAFEWLSSSKYNYSDSTAGEGAVTVTSYVNKKIGTAFSKDKDLNCVAQTPTKENSLRTDIIKGDSSSEDFLENETKILVVTIKLKDEASIYELKNGALTIKVNAGLQDITDDQMVD